MKQKHSYSQIFLKDQKYIEKIVACLDVAGKCVLEIGPGEGVISGHLCKRAAQLYCIEVDKRLSAFLNNKFRQKTNIQIIHADILKFPFSKLGNDTIIFGNVPYHISSQLIKYFIANRQFIAKAYLTFQKEFVEKLIAGASTKQYGFLSCSIQYYAKIKKMFDIPPGAFSPPPKVKSSFVEIEFYQKSPYKPVNEEFLFKVIRRAFSNRRKKIVNSLSKFKIKEDFFLKLGISPKVRPENISLKEYVAIANGIYSGILEK